MQYIILILAGNRNLNGFYTLFFTLTLCVDSALTTSLILDTTMFVSSLWLYVGPDRDLSCVNALILSIYRINTVKTALCTNT